eukprot:gene11230-7985_t
MSTIYHTEPITSGKVVLHTTYGDVDIELWPKEAPLACRNFIQLALEGYYDNTVVHRVIKNFMVQMGDPTGTGVGGQSIWGKPFKDEVHGRIKFNHRGQVAMANENKPNSNQSQFFITLDSCDWLHGKHTIFGKVTGSTFYNAMRMGEVDTGDLDRPVHEIRITSVEVLLNPFDDIVPRVIVKEVKEVAAEKKVKEVTAAAVRNNKLLSFGESEDEEDEPSNLRDDEDSGAEDRELAKRALKRPAEASRPTAKADDDDDDALLDEEAMVRAIKRAKREEGLKSKSNEYTQLRDELLRSRRAVNVLTGAEAANVQKQNAFQEMLTPLEQRRQKYMQRKAVHGHREDDTLSKLDAFKKTLQASKPEGKDEARAAVESYHGQVLEANSDEEENLSDWCSGKLKFKRHVDDRYRQGGDKFRVEEYEVVDPKAQRLKTHQ